MRPGKIISGGQTGVDRAALAFAKEAGIPLGGWAPRRWMAEDGTVPAEFRAHMQEHESDGYLARTHANVVASACTLIIYRRDHLDADGKFTGGTLRTAQYARSRRPISWAFTDEDERLRTVLRIRQFIDDNSKDRAPVLNIAGPRESKAPGIYAATLALLREVWP